MGRKRVNIVLNEDVHKKGVMYAAKAGWDFSEFVNLMLETFLHSEDKELVLGWLKEMFVMEGRRRGFTISKDALQLKEGQTHQEPGKKVKK